MNTLTLSEQLSSAYKYIFTHHYDEAIRLYKKLVSTIDLYSEDDRIMFRSAGLKQWAKMSLETGKLLDILNYRERLLTNVKSNSPSQDDMVDIFVINNELDRFDDNLRLYDYLKDNNQSLLALIWHEYGFYILAPCLIIDGRYDEISENCNFEQDFYSYYQNGSFDRKTILFYQKYALHFNFLNILKILS